MRLMMHRLTSDDGDPECAAQVMHMTFARLSYRSYTEKYWLLQEKSLTSEACVHVPGAAGSTGSWTG